jgi:hypothetical protein
MHVPCVHIPHHTRHIVPLHNTSHSNKTCHVYIPHAHIPYCAHLAMPYPTLCTYIEQYLQLSRQKEHFVDACPTLESLPSCNGDGLTFCQKASCIPCPRQTSIQHHPWCGHGSTPRQRPNSGLADEQIQHKQPLFYSTFIKECDTLPLLLLVAASLFGGVRRPFSLATMTHRWRHVKHGKPKFGHTPLCALRHQSTQALTNIAAQLLRKNWSFVENLFWDAAATVHHFKKRSQPCNSVNSKPKRVPMPHAPPKAPA